MTIWQALFFGWLLLSLVKFAVGLREARRRFGLVVPTTEELDTIATQLDKANLHNAAIDVHLKLWRDSLESDGPVYYDRSIWRQRAGYYNIPALVEVYSLAAAKCPENGELQYKLSVLLKQIGQDEEAQRAWERAVALGGVPKGDDDMIDSSQLTLPFHAMDSEVDDS